MALATFKALWVSMNKLNLLYIIAFLALAKEYPERDSRVTKNANLQKEVEWVEARIKGNWFLIYLMKNLGLDFAREVVNEKATGMHWNNSQTWFKETERQTAQEGK